MTRPAAQALAVAQRLAQQQKFTLKVYDAYWPQKAVDALLAWSDDANDTKMKTEFYPNLSKKDIFNRKYILARSGHSRGSTVDLTLVALPAQASAPYVDGEPLVAGTRPFGQRYGDNSIDMGTGFDVFDTLAHTDAAPQKSQAQRNRTILVDLMQQAGFDNYDKEWWHYTLRHEPYPDTYFDFDP